MMKKSHPHLGVLGLMVLATMGLASCQDEVASVGGKAPSLAVFDLNGQNAKPEKLQGKPVFINFWSAGCGVCLQDMPIIDSVQNEFDGKVRVIGINTDNKNTDLSDALKKVNVHYQLYRDALGITQERYRVQGTPSSYLIDASGKLVKIIEGPPTENKLRKMFTQVLTPAA